jgi:hypothetical protein
VQRLHQRGDDVLTDLGMGSRPARWAANAPPGLEGRVGAGSRLLLRRLPPLPNLPAARVSCACRRIVLEPKGIGVRRN